MTFDKVTSFNQLELNKSLLKALDEVGYETPSPIQAETIPLLLQGRDIIGQAQTGTGKTAAFALPLLSNLNLKQKDPQVLVLAPTRELAIQVAEAFQKYAKHLKGFHVLPVYGGQDYRGQISALKRGVHIVVGTPGRVMDHMRRGTLKLDSLRALVLDEADEMLRMGFIDDVEWVLEQTPDSRQIALFSATMPQQIRQIATKYLNDPEQITIKMTTTTADTIRQRFWPVSGTNKLDALTRILEAEEFDAMIIFVRTKNSTVELADKLEARGHAAAAINGDIQQNQRERSIQHLKNGKLDILVATDVAARGLDVPRISHVLNYDIPHDTESYVHRIGRTGRAGRNGDAILFVAPREKRLLHAIERATKQRIEIMELPSTQLINDQRIVKFKQRISESLQASDLPLYYKMVEQFQQENDVPPLQIAAALALLLQGDTPFLLQNKPHKKSKENWDNKSSDSDRGRFREKFDRDKRGRERSGRERDRPSRRERERSPERTSRKDEPPGKGMARYRIEVGHDHEVKPGNIMGAIANEAGLDSQNIGRIAIHDNYSLVDLPDGMPKEIFNDLKTVWVSGQQLKISRATNERSGSPNNDSDPASSGKARGKPGKKDKGTIKLNEKAKAKKKKRKNKDKGKPKKKVPE
ncbi:DEAD-box ATP-dependent RNA helicase DeaD (= CshA) [hydrothermal vent metagenome]|uniref:RNA helicase n=1 Tax=hydrothermal vent metagenome TaxID=652676 RepID=A0A3B0XLP7_9ZZZZ